MSMETLTIIQFFQVLSAYLCMTFLLPALLLRPRVKKYRFSVRFMIYQLVGNFFMMCLVYLLQLLRISYRVTLILFTIALICIGLYILYKERLLQTAKTVFSTVERLAGGQLGVRLFLRQLRVAVWKGIKKFFAWFSRRLHANFLDILLLIGLTTALVYSYGVNLVENYGYCASDINVHNYWINAMGDNDIFVAGVYPFGFHCVIYYLHTVFHIPTYVLLRVFCFVQTLMIHYTLLAFLKCCTKSRYIAYIGVFGYVLADVFWPNTYTRYFSSLPQEFGMIFILPAIYFLFVFLEKQKQKQKQKQKRDKRERKIKEKLADVIDLNGEEQPEEVIDLNIAETSEEIIDVNVKDKQEDIEELKVDEEKEKKLYLACFVMSFSMTLSAHFYDTMICGIFCIGVAVGYCFRLFHKETFKKVMLAGILAIVIAVLPMGIAYATGTELQGSLGWGLRVITGSDDAGSDDEEEDSTSETDAEDLSSELDDESSSETEISTETGVSNGTEIGDSMASDSSEVQATEESSFSISDIWNRIVQSSIVQRFILIAKNLPTAMWRVVCNYLFFGEYIILCYIVFASMALAVLLSAVFFILRQADYAARLLSTAVYMLFMTILLASGYAGLPRLMDATRTSIFYAYSLAVLWVLDLDAVLHLILGWKEKKWLLNFVSFAAVCLGVFFLWEEDLIRDRGYFEALQTNEAVTCLTNIINENEDETWTIISANDELRMSEDYGYHYEVDTLLRAMEYFADNVTVTMPTEKIYIFIEKIPIDYNVSYENSGQSVSEEGAAEELPDNVGIKMYQGESRWIEMSKMYYWAMEFQSMYPNEMSVYYETDQFVCYVVDQDSYSPLNLAIDYGYCTIYNETKD